MFLTVINYVLNIQYTLFLEHQLLRVYKDLKCLPESFLFDHQQSLKLHSSIAPSSKHFLVQEERK